jgi:hypothetical protein
MMKYFLLVFFLFIVSTQISAQVKTAKPKNPNVNLNKLSYVGNIVKKPWSKSGQSYCAQGSEYFVIVLESSGMEQVLENQTNKKLDDFVGKKVKISGALQTKEIKPDLDGQYPVDSEGKPETFTCKVFVIKKISIIKLGFKE